ncbi:MAG TPA: hypothetical protein ENK52_03455, partial [Saprospiraceae bacterium]|nr:hypothetical protein [Saprospiraceae bacterium]
MSAIIDQQLKTNDCGISAVKTMCNLLQVELPRPYIVEQLPLTQEGVSMESIRQFFNKNGFSSKFHLLDSNLLDQELKSLKDLFPFMVPVKSNRGLHYVILNSYKKGMLEVYDSSQTKAYQLELEAFKKMAYYAQSATDYEDLKDILFLKLKEELQGRPFTIPESYSDKEKVQLFNKLIYFNYFKERFGFKSIDIENDFLRDLIFHQTIASVPDNFKNLFFKSDNKIIIQSPVLLSVKQVQEMATFSDEYKEENIYWRLIKSLKGIRQIWLMFIVTTVVAGMIGYLSVFINQVLIDHVLPAYQLNVLYLFAIGVGIFYLFDIVFSAFKRYVSIHLGNTLDQYFIEIFDRKLNQFSIRYLHEFRRGDLIERLKDSTKIKSFFLSFFSKIFINVIIALVSIFILLGIHWQLSIIVLVVLGLFAGMFVGFSPVIRKLEQKRFEVKADFYSRFIEKIEAIQVIKTLSLEKYSSSEILQSMHKLIKVRTKAKYISLLNSSLSSVIVSLSTLLIIVLTSREMILYQSITLGMIITFVALSGKIFRAFRSLLDYNLALQEHAVILRRFFDFEEMQNKVITNSTGQQKLNKLVFEKLSFKDIYFAYVDDRYVLKELSFEIAMGEKIWIQGKNGS